MLISHYRSYNTVWITKGDLNKIRNSIHVIRLNGHSNKNGSKFACTNAQDLTYAHRHTIACCEKPPTFPFLPCYTSSTFFLHSWTAVEFSSPSICVSKLKGEFPFLTSFFEYSLHENILVFNTLFVFKVQENAKRGIFWVYIAHLKISIAKN